MPSLTRADISDVEFLDTTELGSDGTTPFKTAVTVVSTTASTKRVVVSGYDIKDLDLPLEVGDKVVLAGNAAAGTYTVASIVDSSTFTVSEAIVNSVGGTANFIYPSGASRVGLDPTGLLNTNKKNVQQAVKELDDAIPVLREVEVDFGSVPVRSLIYTLVSGDIMATAKILIHQSGSAPTGKSADENEMDQIIGNADPGNGQATIRFVSLFGPVIGKFKFIYAINK